MGLGTTIMEPPATSFALDHHAPSEKRAVISKGHSPEFVPGRRSWVRYRELGVTEASNGEMRAQVIHATEGNNQPTGWHIHHCDMQFLYVVKGAIHLRFGPGDYTRLETGDSLMIPGGTIHEEMGGAEGCEILEVSVPAEMGTTGVVPPWE